MYNILTLKLLRVYYLGFLFVSLHNAVDKIESICGRAESTRRHPQTREWKMVSVPGAEAHEYSLQ